MNTERKTIYDKMYQTVCDLIHDDGRNLGEEDWRRIFDEALANSFADVGEEDDPA